MDELDGFIDTSEFYSGIDKSDGKGYQIQFESLHDDN